MEDERWLCHKKLAYKPQIYFKTFIETSCTRFT